MQQLALATFFPLNIPIARAVVYIAEKKPSYLQVTREQKRFLPQSVIARGHYDTQETIRMGRKRCSER
jgi:hypothetical protein